MKRHTRKVIAALLLVVSGCSGGGPAEVEGSCTAYVFANDVFYVPIDDFVDASHVSADPHLEVIRYDPACRDQGEGDRPVHGQSNLLPVGTAIHTVDGFDPLERLTYWDADWRSWRVLIQPPSCDAKGGASGTVEEPCGG